MIVLYLLLYLLAGVFFGLAAGRVHHKIDFVAAGLLMWVLVEVLKTIQKV